MDDALVSLKLDKTLLASLQQEAQKADVAIADIVRDAIKRDLRRRKVMEHKSGADAGGSHEWLVKRIKSADPTRA